MKSGHPITNEGACFLLALQFLTRLPVKTDGLYTSERMAASVRYYPLVGALVGGLSALVFLGASAALPQPVAVLSAIAAGLLLTGAFHEDGLADTFDGIGGGLTRRKALEIMRDSRLGTYGTLALFVALALKAAALMALTVEFTVAALIAGHSFSRLSSVLVLATSAYVRAEGTGKPVAGGISPAGLIVALATGCAIAALWWTTLPPMALGLAILALVAGHGLMRAFFEPKLGGYTGDTLGAVQQASEISFYLGLASWV
ncbi:MAG: adenosylcobinamide-GDP ribazoletransferase [Pseudomonadota bacterium]